MGLTSAGIYVRRETNEKAPGSSFLPVATDFGCAHHRHYLVKSTLVGLVKFVGPNCLNDPVQLLSCSFPKLSDLN